MESIPLGEIACESNRKYTKDDSFGQLLNSVREYGIIEPPIVRRVPGGGYRVVAGRRRIEAARQLDFASVDCMVREADDPVDDDEIALTENVNRLEMHPLDEAAAFKRMADGGSPAEEIARFYARSPSAIYKRLRLVFLIEELKGWFRDGVLNISGAAALAELPEEDQQAFCEQYQPYAGTAPGFLEETREIDNRSVMQFVHKRQRHKIREFLGEACQGCGKRTHNSGNDLFEEFSGMDDVCLDGDCYRAKWQNAIGQALADAVTEHGLQTDSKIRFKSQFYDGMPEQLYKKAAHAAFDLGDGFQTRFEVLRDKGWNFTGETKRKKGACYEIGEALDEEGNVRIRVKRVGYEERKPEEKAAKGAKGDPDDSFLDYSFGRDAACELAGYRGMRPAELGEALIAKSNRFNFINKIKAGVYGRAIAERAKDKTPRPYFGLYLRLRGIDESEFDDSEKKLFQELTGKQSFRDIDVPEEMQALFHFFLLCSGDVGYGTLDENVPDLRDVIEGKMGDDEEVFMEYAGLDKEGYRGLWMECARQAMDSALKPGKKGGKGKKPAKKDAAESLAAEAAQDSGEPEGEGGEDNYPFENDAEGDPGMEAM